MGTERDFVFADDPQHLTLRAVDEFESLDTTSIYAGLDSWLLPVEFWYLDDTVGKIMVGTNSDDAAFTLELFERALQEFENNGIDRLVIDLRDNDGGYEIGLAGFLSSEPIPLAQELQRDTKTGEFERRGAPLAFQPRKQTYSFARIAVLVGFGCVSACESEAYALSQLPNVTVVGQYPTGGTYAAVIGDEYLMPENMSLQFSKWRYEKPDGSLFLEGQGVVPTLQVPINQETVVDEDPVGQAALDFLIDGH